MKIIIICVMLIFALGIPRLAWRGVVWIYHHYRIKTMYHYLEYEFHGSHHHTRRSGPLNDLEGTGLLCEVKRRGGSITVHKEGTKQQIAEIIHQRAAQLAAWQSKTFNHNPKG